MTSHLITMALDVRLILKRPLGELRGFTHADGRAMTPREVHETLRSALAHGRELLPIGRTGPFSIIPTTHQISPSKEKV